MFEFERFDLVMFGTTAAERRVGGVVGCVLMGLYTYGSFNDHSLVLFHIGVKAVVLDMFGWISIVA
jgi:hypothetical protein